MNIKRRRIVAALSVLALAGAVPVLSGGAGSAAAAPPDLTVDLGAPTGAVTGGAAGALYGLYDQDVPSDNLIRGMGLRTTDTKAQDGQQHPGSDALEVAAPLVASGGQDVYIYMTDVYRNFPYERTSYAEYQGYLRTEVQQVLTSPYRDHIILVPYNEPEGNWFPGLTTNPTVQAAFNSEWLQTYQLIKGIWPQARLAGPNLSWYYPSALGSFLTFCKANNCLPDVITWHELGVPSTVRPDVAAYRGLEAQSGISPPKPVNLNEYAARFQLTNPGQMVGWLSALTDSGVQGDLPYWNINGSLGDSVAQQNVPNAQWWLYNWYASMTGNNVRVTPTVANSNSVVEGVASLDPAKRQARVLIGGGPAGPKSVLVKGIDPKLFGRSVHATLEQDRWSGMTGAAAQPARILDTDLPVGADGSVQVAVPDGTRPTTDANCTATGAREPGKLGNALKLCGNNEYASLPGGIVSGLHDFTISAWVNPAQNSTWSRIFDFGTGTTANMFLTLNSGSVMRFSITTSGGGNEERIDGTGQLPLNTWSHVAVTVSGNTGTLYVNGVPVGTNPNMQLHPSDLGTTTQNYIGKSEYNDPYLTGAVDDFQIYSRALSGAEVSTLAGGAPGAGDVASYRFDEASGATAVDSSGNGRDATVISDPQLPPSTSAYQLILSPGSTGHSTVLDGTWTQSYEAEDATLTGTGWNINTEGTSGNLGGFATSNNQDVGGLRTGSSTVITFNVDVPTTGDYKVSVYDGSFAHAGDVNGPTNVYLRVDGGAPSEVDLPTGYEWVIWNHADTTVHLTAGAHALSLSTVGSDGAATNGDAIIDKIDLSLLNPAVQRTALYEAEYADLHGARVDYRRQGQSGPGAVDLRGAGQSATFWVYAATDGYADLSFRQRLGFPAPVTVNGDTVHPRLSRLDGPGWVDATARVYLRGGVNQVTVTGNATLDQLAVTPVPVDLPVYQAEDGTLTGTAHVDTSYSRAHGGVVTGIGGGPANALTFHVQAHRGGAYAMTVRFANDTELNATHYNPDLMTAPADISVNGGPTQHFNFANTFSWNQFWTVTIPVRLKPGANTITFIANQQYNYDGKTIGVIYSGSNGVGSPLRSDTAPNIDQITVAPEQLS